MTTRLTYTNEIASHGIRRFFTVGQSATQLLLPPPSPIAFNKRTDCPSDILSKAQSHLLLSSSLDCLDFIPKKKIPSYFNHVLTDESIIQKLIDIVTSPAFDVMLRQRVADLLSLGKMSRIVGENCI